MIVGNVSSKERMRERKKREREGGGGRERWGRERATNADRRANRKTD